MTVVAEKSALRARILAARAGVLEAVRQAFALRLAEIGPPLARRHLGQAGGMASVFHPIRGEPDTAPLLQALNLGGFGTALPVTEGRGIPLRFRAWRPGDAVSMGPWRIPEPLPSAPQVEPDILFVPLAAFDRRGSRLGYGAGFYDDALAVLRRRKPVLAIGIAFALQEVEFVPAEPHDQRLDAVITERDTIVCEQS